MRAQDDPRKLDARRLEKLVASFDRLRLLVLGDAMLDEYLWGDVERVSPEAPVPVVHVQRESVAQIPRLVPFGSGVVVAFDHLAAPSAID